MSSDDLDEKLVERMRQTLRDKESDVTPEQLARLRQAREQAVAVADKRTPARSPWLWSPVGAAAALVLTLSIVNRSSEMVPPAMDERQLAVVQDMEMLDELEFVAWMVEEEALAGELELDEVDADHG